MIPLRVLVVENETDYSDLLCRWLNFNRREFALFDGQELVIDWAADQQTADRLVSEVESPGYDLVFLDLEYPSAPGATDLKFRGEDWAPVLRRSQPRASIIVMTDHAKEQQLALVNRLYVVGCVDEIIPKEEEWTTTLDRSKKAQKKRREIRGLKARQFSPLAGLVRIGTEDIYRALEVAEVGIRGISFAQDAGPGLGTESTRTPFTDLKDAIEATLRRISSYAQEKVEEVDVYELIEDQWLSFNPESADGLAIEFSVGDEVTNTWNPNRLRTYAQDLRVALSNVLENSFDALTDVAKEVGSDANRGTIRVSLCRMKEPERLEITIEDRGTGFTQEALDNLFRPEFTGWKSKRKEHRGMGLYVARRLLISLGGDLVVESAPGAGARVRLIVPDRSA